MSLLHQLTEIPLFHGLQEDQLTTLIQCITQKHIPKGATIFSEGAEATGFYVILAGKVKIHKLSPEGKEQILHIFGPGEPFAEVAVFTGQGYPAFAETLEDSHLLFFPRHEFTTLITQHPTIALNMLAELSLRLRRFTNLIENLSLREVPGRLSSYLIYLIEKQEDNTTLHLDLSKAQLASLLGTIPETLSRILTRMNREGLIEIGEGRQIHILDRQSLEQLASGERRLG